MITRIYGTAIALMLSSAAFAQSDVEGNSLNPGSALTEHNACVLKLSPSSQPSYVSFFGRSAWVQNTGLDDRLYAIWGNGGVQNFEAMIRENPPGGIASQACPRSTISYCQGAGNFTAEVAEGRDGATANVGLGQFGVVQARCSGGSWTVDNASVNESAYCRNPEYNYVDVERIRLDEDGEEETYTETVVDSQNPIRVEGRTLEQHPVDSNFRANPRFTHIPSSSRPGGNLDPGQCFSDASSGVVPPPAPSGTIPSTAPAPGSCSAEIVNQCGVNNLLPLATFGADVFVRFDGTRASQYTCTTNASGVPGWRETSSGGSCTPPLLTYSRVTGFCSGSSGTPLRFSLVEGPESGEAWTPGSPGRSCPYASSLDPSDVNSSDGPTTSVTTVGEQFQGFDFTTGAGGVNRWCSESSNGRNLTGDPLSGPGGYQAALIGPNAGQPYVNSLGSTGRLGRLVFRSEDSTDGDFNDQICYVVSSPDTTNSEFSCRAPNGSLVNAGDFVEVAGAVSFEDFVEVENSEGIRQLQSFQNSAPVSVMGICDYGGIGAGFGQINYFLVRPLEPDFVENAAILPAAGGAEIRLTQSWEGEFGVSTSLKCLGSCTRSASGSGLATEATFAPTSAYCQAARNAADPDGDGAFDYPPICDPGQAVRVLSASDFSAFGSSPFSSGSTALDGTIRQRVLSVTEVREASQVGN